MAKGGWKSVVITQAIAITVFVGVPIVLTLMAPFTDLEWRRTGQTASVTVTRYMLMVVPWRTRTYEGVQELRAEITDEKYYENTSENRRKGRAGATSLSTAQLVIVTARGDETIVQVTPEMAEPVEADFKRFLAAANPEPETYEFYASWWLSYVMGGVATFFAAFYIFGAVAAMVTWPFKRKRNGPPEASPSS